MTADSTAPAPVGTRAEGALLAVSDLHVFYGNIAAVRGLSLAVRPGEIVTLIGSNGAGKSTTLRTISGLLRPRRGSVTFEGRDITRMAGHNVVAAGICHSPEGRRIFPRMTVDENLDLGAFLRKDPQGIKADRDRVLELFPRLQERLAQKAGTLSGGEQQMLAVGRALMGSPKLLLLDEPSMGLAPVLVDLIFDTIQTIRDQGTTVLVVEQNALAALRIADYAYLMESGQLKLDGRGADLAKRRRHRARLPRRLTHLPFGRPSPRPPAVLRRRPQVAGVSRSSETWTPAARRRVRRPRTAPLQSRRRRGCGHGAAAPAEPPEVEEARVTRPPVDVRQAGTGDADDLIELWVQARTEIAGAGRAALGGAPDVIRPRLLDALGRQDGLHLLLARWEGRPAGFAVVRIGHLMPLADDDCVQLEHLFVTPSLRRHGVARALLGAVAGLAERHGADQILSGAPPSAREVHRFLARLGFTPLVLRRVTATATLRRRLAGESRRSAPGGPAEPAPVAAGQVGACGHAARRHPAGPRAGSGARTRFCPRRAATSP